MKADRLNAFTDGVIAIIITIMVLELPVPKGTSAAALAPLAPLFGAYILSFIMVGIFWTNHHHLSQSIRRVSGAVLWANLSLLFCLSLFPFVIRWIGEEGLTAFPVFGYGVVLTAAGIAYLLVEKAVVRVDPGSHVAMAVRGHGKELGSIVLDVAALGLAWVEPWAAVACYVAVAAIWLVPDRRFERLEQ